MVSGVGCAEGLATSIRRDKGMKVHARLQTHELTARKAIKPQAKKRDSSALDFPSN